MISDTFHNKFRIDSIRLPEYDYTQNGYYFVTICTYNREEYFGHIKNGIMCLYRSGSIAYAFWQSIPKFNHHVYVDDAYIVMPNHIHGIVIIDHEGAENAQTCLECIKRSKDVAVQRLYTTTDDTQTNVTQKNAFMSGISPRGGSLSAIIRSYKSACTKTIRDLYKQHKITSYFGWQERFYEHVIRDEKSYKKIREYIYHNPLKWDIDEYNI